MLAFAALSSLIVSAAPAFGQPTEHAPMALHVPYEEIRFGDPQVQVEYDRRCGSDLAALANFSRSALVAEGELNGGKDKRPSRSQRKLVHDVVRKAVLDHRDSQDALFKCLTFLELIATGSEGPNSVAASKAIKLHQGTMTTIDGRIIRILIRIEKIEF